MTTLRRVIASVHVDGIDELSQSVATAASHAAQMGVKQAPFVLAHLQPTPDYDVMVTFQIHESVVEVRVELSAVTDTRLEPYALFAASAAGVCVTDLCGGTVSAAQVEESKGSQFATTIEDARAVVLVLSDTVAAGNKPDTAGKSVADGLTTAGFEIAAYEVLSDEPSELEARLDHWLPLAPQLIITVGGTGIGPRDKAVDIVGPRIETDVPGVMEAARAYGQARTPYSALSRGVAGRIGDTFVLTFPGSRKGAEETLDALLITLIHLVEVHRKAKPHADGYK